MNCIVTEFLFTKLPHFVVAVAFILDFFFHQNRTEKKTSNSPVIQEPLFIQKQGSLPGYGGDFASRNKDYGLTRTVDSTMTTMMSSTVHPIMRGPSTSRKINDAGGPKSSTHGFSSTTNGSTQFWDVMNHVHVTLDEVNEGIDYLESQLDCNVNDAETASSSAELIISPPLNHPATGDAHYFYLFFL